MKLLAKISTKFKQGASVQSCLWSLSLYCLWSLSLYS